MELREALKGIRDGYSKEEKVGFLEDMGYKLTFVEKNESIGSKGAGLDHRATVKMLYPCFVKPGYNANHICIMFGKVNTSLPEMPTLTPWEVGQIFGDVLKPIRIAGDDNLSVSESLKNLLVNGTGL